MGKKDISSWASATEPLDNGDDGESRIWQKGQAFTPEEWSRAAELARGKLLTSRTGVRIQFLKEELLPLAKNGGK